MIGEERTNDLLAFSYALQGLGLGIVLSFFAMLSIDLPGWFFGLTFLPVAAIFCWPEKASYSWSLFAVFVFGLFFDIVSGGPLGVWALSLLVLFIVLGGRAEIRHGLTGHIVGYALCVVFVFVLVLVFGRLSLGHWPQIFGLLINALATIAVFPFLYWLRSMYVTLRAVPGLSGLRE